MIKVKRSSIYTEVKNRKSYNEVMQNIKNIISNDAAADTVIILDFIMKMFIKEVQSLFFTDVFKKNYFVNQGFDQDEIIPISYSDPYYGTPLFIADSKKRVSIDFKSDLVVTYPWKPYSIPLAI